MGWVDGLLCHFCYLVLGGFGFQLHTADFRVEIIGGLTPVA